MGRSGTEFFALSFLQSLKPAGAKKRGRLFRQPLSPKLCLRLFLTGEVNIAEVIDHLQHPRSEAVATRSNRNNIVVTSLDILELIVTKRAGRSSTCDTLIVSDRHSSPSQTGSRRSGHSAANRYTSRGRIQGDVDITILIAKGYILAKRIRHALSDRRCSDQLDRCEALWCIWSDREAETCNLTRARSNCCRTIDQEADPACSGRCTVGCDNTSSRTGSNSDIRISSIDAADRDYRRIKLNAGAKSGNIVRKNRVEFDINEHLLTLGSSDVDESEHGIYRVRCVACHPTPCSYRNCRSDGSKWPASSLERVKCRCIAPSLYDIGRVQFSIAFGHRRSVVGPLELIEQWIWRIKVRNETSNLYNVSCIHYSITLESRRHITFKTTADRGR